MNESILKQLNLIFEDVLDISGLQLQAETTANEIAEWDSVNHLILLHAIEEHFHFKFELSEIINFRTVGDICRTIAEKTA